MVPLQMNRQLKHNLLRAQTLSFFSLFPPEYLAQGLLWRNKKKYVVGKLFIEFELSTTPQRPEGSGELCT